MISTCSLKCAFENGSGSGFGSYCGCGYPWQPGCASGGNCCCGCDCGCGGAVNGCGSYDYGGGCRFGSFAHAKNSNGKSHGGHHTCCHGLLATHPSISASPSYSCCSSDPNSSFCHSCCSNGLHSNPYLSSSVVSMSALAFHQCEGQAAHCYNRSGCRRQLWRLCFALPPCHCQDQAVLMWRLAPRLSQSLESLETAVP